MNIVLLAVMVMCVVFAISFLAWKVKDLEVQMAVERERNRKLWVAAASGLPADHPLSKQVASNFASDFE